MSDWSSDVCSSDLIDKHFFNRNLALEAGFQGPLFALPGGDIRIAFGAGARRNDFFAGSPTGDVDRRRDNLFAYGELLIRSEEHTSELQSLMRISYAVFCLKKQNRQHNNINL